MEKLTLQQRREAYQYMSTHDNLSFNALTILLNARLSVSLSQEEYRKLYNQGLFGDF